MIHQLHRPYKVAIPLELTFIKDITRYSLILTHTVQLEWEAEVSGQDSIIVVDNIMVSSGECPIQAQTCDFEYENGVDKYCGGKVFSFW